MELISVNTATDTALSYREWAVKTRIFKQPVSGRVIIRPRYSVAEVEELAAPLRVRIVELGPQLRAVRT